MSDRSPVAEPAGGASPDPDAEPDAEPDTEPLEEPLAAAEEPVTGGPADAEPAQGFGAPDSH